MNALPAAEAPVAGAVDAGAGKARRELLRELLHSKTFAVGGVIMLISFFVPGGAFWCFCAIFGYHIGPYGPFDQDLNSVNAAPSSTHWFGTDQLGRDVFSRVIAGARTVLVVSLVATVLGTVLGTILGLITGYLRGWVDETIANLADAIAA